MTSVIGYTGVLGNDGGPSLELSRSILHNCDSVLSPDERRRIFERIVRCAKELGDTDEQKAWQGKAEAL